MSEAVETWPGRPYPFGAVYDGAGTAAAAALSAVTPAAARAAAEG